MRASSVRLDTLDIVFVANDPGCHDDHQLSAFLHLVFRLEQAAEEWHIAQVRHLALKRGTGLGDQSAENDSLAISGTHGRISRRPVESAVIESHRRWH